MVVGQIGVHGRRVHKVAAWLSKLDGAVVGIRNQRMAEGFALVLIVRNYIVAICRHVLYLSNRQSMVLGVRGDHTVNVAQNAAEVIRLGTRNNFCLVDKLTTALISLQATEM